MSFIIESIGTAVPQHSILQEEAAAFAMARCESEAKQRRFVPALFRRSGVRKRHSVVLKASTNGEPAQQDFYQPMDSEHDRGPTTAPRMQAYGDSAAELAIGATADALSKTEIAASEITHLVTVSCSGFSAPGFDIALINELGVTIERQQNAHWLYGLSRRTQWPARCQSVCRGRSCRKRFYCALSNCARFITNMVGIRIALSPTLSLPTVRPQSWDMRSQERTNGTWQLAASGSSILPETEDLMGWCIGDHGFEMNLSPRVPDTIRKSLRPWLEQWLAEQTHQLKKSAPGQSIQGDRGSWTPAPKQLISAAKIWNPHDPCLQTMETCLHQQYCLFLTNCSRPRHLAHASCWLLVRVLR